MGCTARKRISLFLPVGSWENLGRRVSLKAKFEAARSFFMSFLVLIVKWHSNSSDMLGLAHLCVNFFHYEVLLLDGTTFLVVKCEMWKTKFKAAGPLFVSFWISKTNLLICIGRYRWFNCTCVEFEGRESDFLFELLSLFSGGIRLLAPPPPSPRHLPWVSNYVTFSSLASGPHGRLPRWCLFDYWS